MQISFTATETDRRFAQGSVAWWLMGAWVLTMILIPIMRWTVGDAALHWGVMFSVTALALAVVVALWQACGRWSTLWRVLTIAPLAWGLEWLGSTTGLPFGEYHYTPTLQPQVAGVPIIIPLAWLMMLPPAWAVASVIVGGRRDWRFVLVSAAAFTAWDLFLDPQMVGWGYWVWAHPGGYFGIPWLNFAGWLLGSALLTLITRPQRLPLTFLVTIYAVTWALQTMGQLFFWQMPGPALVGGIGMGSFLWLAYRATRENAAHPTHPY